MYVKVGNIWTSTVSVRLLQALLAVCSPRHISQVCVNDVGVTYYYWGDTYSAGWGQGGKGKNSTLLLHSNCSRDERKSASDEICVPSHILSTNKTIALCCQPGFRITTVLRTPQDSLSISWCSMDEVSRLFHVLFWLEFTPPI